MVNCEVCNGQEFTQKCGFYYCNECQTQCRNWREEDTELGAYVSSKFNKIYLAPNANVMQFSAIDRCLMTNWTSFNMILIRQVEQLEQLPGVDRRLRITVMRLWTSYLSQLEADLCEPKDTKIPKVKSKNTSYNDSASEVSSHRYRHIVNRYKKALFTQECEELSTFEGYNESSDWFSSCGSISGGSTRSSVGSSFATLLEEKDVQDLSRIRLAGILYLGLLLSCSKAQISDLLRWMRHDKVSYKEVFSLLPVENQFVLKKLQTAELFATCKIPTPESLIMIANLQADLIGIRNVPQPDLMFTANKFIKELNLPDQLATIIGRLITKYSNECLRKNKKVVAQYETHVMALVVVGLKLLLGLDGTCEHHLPRMVNAHLINSTAQTTFDWDQWVEFINARNSVLAHSYFWAKHMLDPDSPEDIHLYKVSRNCNSFRTKTRVNQMKLKSLKELLCQLTKTSQDSAIKTTASLTPMSDGLKELLTQPPPLGQQQWPPILSSQFEHCILPLELKRKKKLLKKLKKIPVKTMVWNFTKLPPNLHTKKFHKVFVTTVLNSPSDSSKIQKAKVKLGVRAQRKTFWMLNLGFLTGPKFRDESYKLPASFLWLLQQCSMILGTKTFVLYKEVRVIEEILCSYDE